MKTTRRLVASALTTGLMFTLWGCSTSSLTDPPPVPTGGFAPFNVNQPNTPVAPRFDPGLGAVSLGLSGIPIPNDILRDPNPGPTQGRNIVSIPAGTDPTDSIRSLRGFSTAGNILIPFDGKIDAASANANTILLVEGEGSTAPAGSTGTNATVACNITVLNPLGSTTGTTSTVILQPRLPLRPITNYYCVVTAGVTANGVNVGSPKTTTTSGVVDTGLLLKSPNPLVDANGNTLIFPVTDAQARQLEPLRLIYQSFWARAEAITGQPRASIPLVFRFGTQPLFATLASPINTAVTDPPNGNPGLRSRAALDVGTTGLAVPPQAPTAGAGLNNSRTGPVPALLGANGFIPIADNSGPGGGGLTLLGSNRTVAQFFADLANVDRNIITGAVQVNGNPGAARYAGAAFNNINRIYTGNITCGNYINPATGFFQGENLPLAGSPGFTRFGDVTVTFFLCLPSAFPFANPPTNTIPSVHRSVIFQHGIDNDKRDVFLVANELCGAGFGVVAIDLHLHGDLRTNPALPNGTGFINPANMRASRDNVRQSISNLFYVSEAIIGGRSNVDGWPGPNAGGPPVPAVPDLTTPQAPVPVNGPGPSFVALSLGAVPGGPFTAVTPFSSRAVFNATGGRLSEFLLRSNRGPAVRQALAAAGIVEGTDAFAQFFWVFQTIADDVDSLNYAAPTFLTQAQGGFKPNLGPLGQQAATVLLQELTGDTTVNNATTQDLARAFGQFPLFRHVQPVVTAVQGLAAIAGPYQGPGYFQFPLGLGHEAILGLGGGNTAAVRTQMVNFLTSTPATITP